jgi:hypothetical protein
MTRDDDILYDPETGEFWRKAGCQGPVGYRQIWFRGRQELEHRVAWFLHYGEWPSEFIDHINGVKNDNRISNLRLATPSQNLQNRGRPKNNTSGRKGVSWIKFYSKWQATIRVGKKNIYLGRFSCIEKAADAYNAAALKYHGEFARLDL